MRFNLKIDNRSPMNLSCNAVSPYTDPAYTAPGDLAGWQVLDTRFGSIRAGSFALYARSNQDITIHIEGVQHNRWPRFPISKIGFHLHYYSVSESDFEFIWRSTVEEEFDYGDAGSGQGGEIPGQDVYVPPGGSI
jgi:hypothetical protein